MMSDRRTQKKLRSSYFLRSTWFRRNLQYFSELWHGIWFAVTTVTVDEP
jgi:hypothetical protein